MEDAPYGCGEIGTGLAMPGSPVSVWGEALQGEVHTNPVLAPFTLLLIYFLVDGINPAWSWTQNFPSAADISQVDFQLCDYLFP